MKKPINEGGKVDPSEALYSPKRHDYAGLLVVDHFIQQSNTK